MMNSLHGMNHTNHSAGPITKGTAPMMEVEGTVRIFQRSIEKRNVRNMEYYGDGDSKAYSTVKDTYKPDISIKKECIGHYQKRVGTRLRKAKMVNKGLKGLPDWMIDKLQNYFGIALTRLFQSFIKRRFSFTTFCACANFVNINISANALWQSPLKSYDFK